MHLWRVLASTRGLVLRQTRYGEGSLILQVYTEQFGSQGYVVSGVRSAKSRLKAAMFQPMTLLELVVYQKEGKDLHRIREARFAHVYARIPFEPARRAVGLFMSEVLLRALREEPPHPELYAFAEQAFLILDRCERGLSAFPAAFLVGISRHLGFDPQGSPGPNTPYFDLRDGNFTAQRPIHGEMLMPDEGAWLLKAAAFNWDEPKPMGLLPAQRQILLDRLLVYVRHHVAGFGTLKSPAVLHDIMARD